MTTESDLRVVAVVKVNGKEAFVLNRPINITYEKVGRDFIGSDGPFKDALAYDNSGLGKAFAGRSFDLKMKDGSVETIKDHWWDVGIKGHVGITACDIDSLKRCYVFCGYSASPEEIKALRDAYEGDIYSYRDYEKVINYDDMRRSHWKKEAHLEQRVRALIKSVKNKHKSQQELLSALIKAQSIIDDMSADLLNRRVVGWYPEGTNNAALSMSEDMRLLGNQLADVDFTDVIKKARGEA